MHFAYILYSPSKNKYYMGSCQDIEYRIRKHNTNDAGFTGKTGDWILKWIEEHPDKTSALKTRKTNKELEKPRFDRKTYWSLDRLVLSIPILHREGHWFEPSSSHIESLANAGLFFILKRPLLY
jgi:putative endonuclease